MVNCSSRKMRTAWKALLWVVILAHGAKSFAATEPVKLSLQQSAFAPNAGGQTVYGLRIAHNNREYSIFQNQYLTAGDKPLSGGLYSWRFPACDTSCFVHLHAQAGLGITTAGPMAEFLWGGELPLLPLAVNGGTIRYVPMLRLDFASHWIATTQRVITWSYPYWLGITVPL